MLTWPNWAHRRFAGEAPQLIGQLFEPLLAGGREDALSIFKFIRLRPPTIVDLVMIAIGLASLYVAYLQLVAEGMAG